MPNYNIPGTQRQVNLSMIQGYPGDLASNRTITQNGAIGLIALPDTTVPTAPIDVFVGKFGFACSSGNQVCSNATIAGLVNPMVAGFVLRNYGSAPMTWVQSAVGFGMSVPDGKIATVAFLGDFISVVTGVDTTGTANHVPVIGDILWANNIDGSVASTSASVTLVTGYTLAPGLRITQVGLIVSFTPGVNQTAAIFSGYLGTH